MNPRLFHLQRDTDITGASGTGRVADGVLWPDRTVTLRWRGEMPSTVNWSELAHAEAVHGHDGATRIVFDDETEDADDPTQFTERGFAIYGHITDSRGNRIRVQESSAADDSYVWLFLDARAGEENPVDQVEPHLSVEQATELRDALNRFLKHCGA